MSYCRKTFFVTIACCAIIAVFVRPAYSQAPPEKKPAPIKAPAGDAEKLSASAKLIKDYFKAKTPEERGRIIEELEKIGFMPPAKDLSRIIKEAAVYPDMAPLKRTTRKIKVNGEEYTYELSPPKGYSPKKEEPLIISLHGSGGDGMNALHLWRIHPDDQDAAKDKIIDSIILSGQTPPPKNSMRVTPIVKTEQYIIAAPTLEKVPQGGAPTDLLEHLLPALLQDVTSTCNVDTNRIFIVGFSMGGHFTWAETLHQPDYFAGAIPMMGACDDMNTLSNLQSLPVYIIHGDKDTIVPVECSRSANEALTALKYDVIYREQKGLGHYLFSDKSPECAKLLAWIKSKTRNPYIKKISYRFSGQSAPVKRIYWLEVSQKELNPFTVEAEVADNTINIKSAGLAEMTVLLNSEIVDFAKDVIIRVNGNEVFKGKSSPSYKFLLENYQEYKDPNSLFTAGVKLKIR
ncbi:MAG: dienelactone hydrolase family protein [Planctomycetes bacterium]|nr:dienelactone hydrolase family protein [Planctomycetota bacterium]